MVLFFGLVFFVVSPPEIFLPTHLVGLNSNYAKNDGLRCCNKLLEK